ncbi:SusC/RagA family TonB-linked outer membrane protein [Spirosoma montaniterrae]|uniref:SusC/RagA family TonB-linked outer membrane protein n=1 Tax=Spirosoma montaniterrae TaxID=1178516 RepID=A0A1P9WVZ5_9BACT|nr:TonB-dependent receptor [Spirosoma montaniterrae]AQG79565.1 SusC/RagA family TonB-linked outer membrane protein [Spirosoma montaniterrae]
MKRNLLKFRLVGLMLFFSITALAQNVITGKVIDAKTRELLPGATIQLEGTTVATITNAEGTYSLTVPRLNGKITVSYVGFLTKTVDLLNRKSIDVELEPNVSLLDDVVVIGYGTAKKSDITGSVASLTEKSFNKGVNVSAEQLIAGKVSGVQIIQNSGEPGGGITVNIRGMGSLNAGNAPLYVVDGFPIDNSTTVSGTGANFTGMRTARNPLNSINPADIASIEVLKDASATAIYGSRGANGVVLITTKRGKEGGLKVSYDAYYGVQNIMNDINLLSANEYKTVMNSLIDAGAGNVNLKIGEFSGGTDWLRQMYRKNAPINSHNISFSGGNQSTKYFTSLNYFDQDGVLINSANKRYSARVNLEHTNKNFTIGTNITSAYVADSYVANGMDLNERAGIIYAAIAYEPTLSVFDQNNNYVLSKNMNIDNPLAIANGKTSTSDLYRTLGSVYGEVKFLTDFTARLNLGADISTQRRDTYVDRQTIEGRANGGIASILTGTNNSFLSEFTLNYKKRFGRQDLNLLFGTTAQQFDTNDQTSQASGFPSDATKTDNLSLGDPTRFIATSSKSRNSLLSYLGRVNYNLSDKYLLTTSLRIDGSSRFGENNKYGVFPSVAFAWRLENEEFFKNAKYITSLKLRSSWGQTGNQAIDNYQSLTTYTTGQKAVIGNQQVSATTPNRLPNPNLKWETSEQLNFGLDFGFWGNRITGSLDWFTKTTKDMLLNLPIPRTTGFSTMMTNIGSVRNGGFEVLINSNNLSGPLSWETTLNMTWLHNKVLDLGGIQNIFTGSAGGTANVSIIKEGLPMYSFYGYTIDGVWQTEDDFTTTKDNVKPGDFKYRDLNGDKVVNADDRQVIGNPFPKFIASLTNNFTYKGFNLNIFLDGSWGAKMLNNNLVDTYFPANLMRNRLSEPLLNRWTPSNPSSVYPSFINPLGQGKKEVNTYTVENANFLRLNTIRVGYDFAVKNFAIKGLGVFVTGQNMAMWTNYRGYDPSINPNGGGVRIDWNAFPTARTILFGVNINL